MGRVSALLCGATMVLFAGAGLAKLWELSAFWEYVDQNLAAPRAVNLGLSVGVPTAEAAVGGLWLAGIARRRMAIAAMDLLAAFSVFLVWSVVTGKAGPCRCFGALKILDADAAKGVARNVVMAMALAGYLVTRGRGGARRRASEGDVRVGGANARGGFALVEVLVVLGLVALLVALALPSLALVRDRARDASTLALLRQHGAVMLNYAGDYRDVFPYFTDPSRATTPVFHSGGLGVDAAYFEAYYLWPIAMSDAYYAGSLSRDLWTPPSMPRALRGSTGIGNILYPCVFIAHPEYWRLETRLAPPSQLQATRTGDVAHPVSKVLLYSRYPGELLPDRPNAKHPLVAVDGHAMLLDRGREPAQTPFGDGGWKPWSFHRASTEPFLHSLGGVRAREF